MCFGTGDFCQSVHFTHTALSRELACLFVFFDRCFAGPAAEGCMIDFQGPRWSRCKFQLMWTVPGKVRKVEGERGKKGGAMQRAGALLHNG